MTEKKDLPTFNIQTLLPVSKLFIAPHPFIKSSLNDYMWWPFVRVKHF